MCTKKLFNLELYGHELTSYLHHSFEKYFEDLKEIIIWKFSGDWGELQKTLLAQSIAYKINKIMSRNKKTGQDLKL